MWRILIGIGCVPGVIALFFRLTIPETPRFTMDIERNINQAEQDIDNFLRTGTFVVDPDARIERVQARKASWSDFKKYFSNLENLRVLVGCAYCWFALDVSLILVSYVFSSAEITSQGCVLWTWLKFTGTARHAFPCGCQRLAFQQRPDLSEAA